MRKILIIGATSAIAQSIARVFAERGDHLFLVARDAVQLDCVAADLRVRGSSKVDVFIMDANHFDEHAVMLDEAERVIGALDVAVIAHGTLSDQQACQQSVSLTMEEIKTNALSCVALLTDLANRFEHRQRGTIAVISSVAGDRGRRSNYVYGSAKAMVTAFTSGLGQRLHKSGVSVVTIKPGLVDTPMTEHFKKGALWAKPTAIARSTVAAIDSGMPVCYAPAFWRLVMAIIRSIPEKIFRRISL